MRVTGTSLFSLVAATVSAGSFYLAGHYMHADAEDTISHKVSMTSVVQSAACLKVCDDDSMLD